MRRLSEYGSVAYLVETPTRETRAEQYSDTVLQKVRYPPRLAFSFAQTHLTDTLRSLLNQSRPLNGGVSNRGASRSGRFCPFVSFCVLFLSFLGLSRFSWDFPDLLGDGPGIFPSRSFSAY